MNLMNNRFFPITIGILLVIIGLFFSNPFIGIAICILLALSVFFDEKLLLLFLIITIPIRPFLIVYNTGYKFVGDILILVLLFKVIYDQRKNIRQLFRFNILEIAFLLFIGVGIISALLTGVAIPAIVMQVRAFLLFFLLYYIVKRMNVTSKDINDFALVTFTTAVVLSIQGLVEKISVRTLLLPEIWRNMELAYTNKTRVYGLIGGPNELALFLFISFMVSLYLLFNAKGKAKLAYFIGMTLMFCVFLLTYSRGAVLAVIAFLIIYLFFNKKIPHFKSILLVGMAASLLFLATTSLSKYVENQLNEQSTTKTPTVNKDQNQNKTPTKTEEENGLNRFSGAFSEENIGLSSADGRVFYVKKAIEVFRDRPILGYGFATFGGAATQTYSSPIYKDYGIAWNFYSDNQYIQILAETGVVGTALIILFVLCLIKFTWVLRKSFPFSPILSFFIIGALASGVVYNILENDVFTMYYFIILGFAHHYLDKVKNQQTKILS